jgi:hypothetical protein
MPSDPPQDAAYQVWTQAKTFALYSVHVTTDSLSGIPLIFDRHCEECRVILNRSVIDSIRIGDPANGTITTFGIFGALVGAWFATFILLYSAGVWKD